MRATCTDKRKRKKRKTRELKRPKHEAKDVSADATEEERERYRALFDAMWQRHGSYLLQVRDVELIDPINRRLLQRDWLFVAEDVMSEEAQQSVRDFCDQYTKEHEYLPMFFDQASRSSYMVC